MRTPGAAVAATTLILFAGCGGREAPEAIVTRDGAGLLVGAFDHAELSAFLVAHELPPLDRALEGIEAGIAESLAGALATLEASPSAEAYGRVGMILDYIQCLPTARAAYARAEALSPLDARWPHLIGRLDALAGDRAAAERSFRRAIELRPGFAPTYVRLGRLLAAGNRAGEAEDALETAVRLDPSLMIAHRELGRLAVRAGRWDEALDRLERARRLAPADGQVHALLGRTYDASGDRERARAHARRAGPDGEEAAVLPDPLLAERVRVSGALLNERRAAQRHFEEGRIDEMIASLERIVARDSSDVRNTVDLCTALAAVGRGAEADRLAAEARQRFARHPSPLEATGRIAAARGDWAGAIRWTDAALERDPDWARAHSTRAIALYNTGSREEAAAAARRATEADPTDVASYRLEAEALVALERPGEALAALRRGLEANPDASELRELVERATVEP